MKASKIIQAIAVALRVVCIIMIVLYALAALGCVIGLAETAIFDQSGTVTELIVDDFLDCGNLPMTELRVVLGGGIAVAVAEMLVCIFLSIYFKHELAAGTPFTFEGAKELLLVGIKALICFAAAMAICCFIRLIAVGSTDISSPETELLIFSGKGAEIILMSLLLRFGAEEKENKE